MSVPRITILNIKDWDPKDVIEYIQELLEKYNLQDFDQNTLTDQSIMKLEEPYRFYADLRAYLTGLYGIILDLKIQFVKNSIEYKNCRTLEQYLYTALRSCKIKWQTCSRLVTFLEATKDK